MGLHNASPKLGGDPEFFVRNNESGNIISADKFFPPKTHKMPVKINNSLLGELFFDGVQAEMNFRASECRESICYAIFQVLSKAKKVIGDNHSISTISSVVMPLKDLREADPEARRFGCNPDWNAYTGLMNECTLDGETHRTRYAGAHIHVGFSRYGQRGNEIIDNPQLHLNFVKLCDIIVGIPAILLDRSPESIRRKKTYGKAGCFRPTEYGIEYRVLSNFWLQSPVLVSLMMAFMRSAVSVMDSKLEDKFFNEIPEEDVIAAINSNSFGRAIKIYNKYKSIMTKLIDEPGSTPWTLDPYFTLDRFEFVVNKGISQLIPPAEISWGINDNGAIDTYNRSWVKGWASFSCVDLERDSSFGSFSKRFSRRGPFLSIR